MEAKWPKLAVKGLDVKGPHKSEGAHGCKSRDSIILCSYAVIQNLR